MALWRSTHSAFHLKVRDITEELVGHSFLISSVSAVVKKFDAELTRFVHRRLKEPLPYVDLDTFSSR